MLQASPMAAAQHAMAATQLTGRVLLVPRTRDGWAEGRACMSLPLGFGNKAGHLVFTWAAAAPTTPSLARGTASLPRVTCSQPRSVRGLVGRRLTIARDRLCLPTASRADCAESALNAPSPARGRADTHAVACAQHGFVAVRGVLPAAELVAPRRRRGSYCPSAAPHVRAERGRLGGMLEVAGSPRHAPLAHARGPRRVRRGLRGGGSGVRRRCARRPPRPKGTQCNRRIPSGGRWGDRSRFIP